MNELLFTAIEASIKAGKKILEIYDDKNFDVKFKNDSSPLTKADTESNNIIIEFLNNTNIPVLSEESEHIDYQIRKLWKKLWIVDPLDGTKEFIKRNGEFTVNIALVIDKKPVIGVIYSPVLGDLYYSSDEIGSYKVNINEFDKLNINKNSIRLPIVNKKNDFTIVASRSHLSKETLEFIERMKKKYDKVKIISKGSSLKFCLVAEGSANTYPRFAPTMEWDTAAGQSICECAGFKVKDLKTENDMNYNRQNLLNNWFIVE